MWQVRFQRRPQAARGLRRVVQAIMLSVPFSPSCWPCCAITGTSRTQQVHYVRDFTYGRRPMPDQCGHRHYAARAQEAPRRDPDRANRKSRGTVYPRRRINLCLVMCTVGRCRQKAPGHAVERRGGNRLCPTGPKTPSADPGRAMTAVHGKRTIPQTTWRADGQRQMTNNVTAGSGLNAGPGKISITSHNWITL